MIPPKEKAKELVYKYLQFVDCGDNRYTNKIQVENAKQCALIAVDEIIFALNDDIYIQGETDIDSHRDYWQEVKQEIEKF